MPERASLAVEHVEVALARLRQFGGDELARDMIALFSEVVPERLAAARHALAADDRDTLAREAHSLKSSCAQLGGHDAERLAASLERLAPSADPAALGTLLEALDAACRVHVDRLARTLSGAGEPA